MADILIVDDERGFRSMLRMALKSAGHTSREAADGRDALRMFNERPADLIIMDLIMPEKEGIETIIEIRRQDNQVKIIAMSGVASHLKLARTLGANQTICKPFSIDEMLVLIKTTLG